MFWEIRRLPKLQAMDAADGQDKERKTCRKKLPSHLLLWISIKGTVELEVESFQCKCASGVRVDRAGGNLIAARPALLCR